jgi:predicted choloylglycine hydrolase
MNDTVTAAQIRNILRQCRRIAEAADDLRQADIQAQAIAYRILEDVIDEATTAVNGNQRPAYKRDL